MKKNGFLTFCCSLFPGFGQMYQGYMRRGVSLALWFWGLAFIAGMLGLGVMTFLMIVIWAYSFFDTFNLRSLSPEQRAMFQDDYVPSSAWLAQHKLDGLLKGGRGARIGGWVLIGIGVIVLYNSFLSSFYYQLLNTLPFLAYFLDRLPQLIIAVAVILLGIRMLKGRGQPPADDDMKPFGGNQNA